MTSISASWSSGVSERDAIEGLGAITDIVTSLYRLKWPWGLIDPIVSLRPYGNWLIPALSAGTPYSSFDWYVDEASDPSSDAVEAGRLLDLIEREPWQQEHGHLDFCLIDRRLVYRDEPAAPFAAVPGLAVVISTHWTGGVVSLERQRLALRRLGWYGFGLAAGLQPHRTRETVCAMRPFEGRGQLLEMAEQEAAADAVLCPRHMTQLLSSFLTERVSLS